MDQRIVFLPDIHVPDNIPLDPVLEFIQDFKPTKIILGGDIHNWTSVSTWIADQSRHLDGNTVLQNYEELKKIVFQPLIYAASDADMVLLTGNHEHWLTQASHINPNGWGYWGLKENLSYIPRLIIEPINIPHKASHHLYYVHGLYTNKYHAEKTVSTYQRSILYGHTHDIQVATLISPLDVTQLHKAGSCGCLCNRNPSYMKNRPNKWVHGFNFAYVEEATGFFHDVQVYIINGKFWANGRKYK